MRNILALFLLTLLLATPTLGDCSAAQTTPLPPDPDTLDRLAHLGLSVRKSFTGKKDENQPAAISYLSASHGGSAYNIDFAVRHAGIDCSNRTSNESAIRKQLLLFPSAEVHRSSIPSAEVNK